MVIKDELIALLTKAVENGITKDLVDEDLPFPFFCRYDCAASIKEKLKQILATDSDVLNAFDKKMFYIGTSGSQVDLADLAHWLLKRTSEKSPQDAAEGLERFLHIQEIPCRDVLVFGGIVVGRAVSLCDDIQLKPFMELPDSSQKVMVLRHTYMHLGRTPLYQFTSALVAPNTMQRMNSSWPEYKPRLPELQDACRYLTLIGPSSPLPMFYWCEPEEWVPLSGTRGTLSTYTSDVTHGDHSTLSDEDIQKWDRLYKLFISMTPSVKQQLDRSIDRLNLSIRRKDMSDAAIELGIALESLLLNDQGDNEALALRLRLRGAWLLGETATQRVELTNTLQYLYKCRSTAIHTGTIEDKIKGIAKPTKELLKEGQVLASRIVEAIANMKRFPKREDWDQIVLGQTMPPFPDEGE